MVALFLMLMAGQDAVPPSTPVDDVVVHGVRDAARIYVADTIRPRRSGQQVAQIARWSSPVCVRVIGPDRAGARALEVGVAETLRAMDVPVAGPRCSANAVIAITDRPGEFSERIARRHRFALFRNNAQSLNSFIEPGREMRWMHRITYGGDQAPGAMGLMTEAQDGGSGSNPTPVGRTMLSGGGGVDILALSNSNIDLSTGAQIDRAMVVLDTRAAQAAPRQPLIDYLAYTVAVDRSDRGEVTSGGVLSLFGPAGLRDRSAVLTDQDVSFVRALYASEDRRSASMQGVDIINRMERQARKRDAVSND